MDHTGELARAMPGKVQKKKTSTTILLCHIAMVILQFRSNRSFFLCRGNKPDRTLTVTKTLAARRSDPATGLLSGSPAQRRRPSTLPRWPSTSPRPRLSWTAASPGAARTCWTAESSRRSPLGLLYPPLRCRESESACWSISLKRSAPARLAAATSRFGRVSIILIMVFSKVEVNLRRLLEAAPRQQNQAKLVHYITTARELLEQLGAEITPEGTSSNLIDDSVAVVVCGANVSKAKLSEYSEKIEALATTLAAPVPENENPVDENREEESPYEREKVGSPISLSSGLRRRSMAHGEVGPSSHERKERDTGAAIKLDAEAQAHIEKHRKLQEDLTDEMVDLARQLKESSMLMNQSVQDTEKILDSTERAVEHSLASTGRATARASEVYSLASKTTCFQWLLIFMMTCMFVMVVLLIRVT